MTKISDAEAIRLRNVRPSAFQVNIDEKLAQPEPTPIRRAVKDFMPLRDQVLVRPVKKEDKSESGLIWLPTKGQEPPAEGEVIAAGRGKFDLMGRFVPSEIEPGDRVLYNKYQGTKIMLNGVECLILTEEQIQGLMR